MSDGLWTYERLRTCPRCHELNGPYSVYCVECGTRLIPSERELEQAKRTQETGPP